MITVVLRDRSFAEIISLDEPGVFTMRGFTRDGQPQLWRSNGRWRYDDQDHPLDILGQVVDTAVVAFSQAVTKPQSIPQ